MQLAPLRRRSIRAAVARFVLPWLDPGAADAALRRPPMLLFVDRRSSPFDPCEKRISMPTRSG
jgi:hypothetical protein